MARSQRQGWDMAVAMVDIDRFKQVNDTHGHAMGDRVIKSLARLLESSLRTEDLVGRYGGEEFVVAFSNCNVQQAVQRLNALREDFAQIVQDAETAFSCTFSAGIAGYPVQDSVTKLLESADQALYRAKQAGRNRIEIG
jgi:diguanylate cyclase (GGDEF)-like protein